MGLTMNKRIQELMKETTTPIGRIGNWGKVQWDDNIYPQMGDELYAGVDLEKFAELIVQECARVAKATACPYHGNELTPQNAHTWDMASLESGKGILDHFGID
jgi:hypothetical protein